MREYTGQASTHLGLVQHPHSQKYAAIISNNQYVANSYKL
jgi:hypothetical protein